MSPSAVVARRRSLRFHRRLETHVGVAVTLVVVFALVSALLIATRVITAGSFERASNELDAARSAFYLLEDERAEFAAAQAMLVTALPMFRAYMTDSRLLADHATMQVMADDFRQQLKAAFCVVTGRDGTWSASSGWTAGLEPPGSIRRMIAASAAGQPRRDIAEVGDRLFLIVSEPARFAEETLGTLTVGYALDDAVARQIAQITHCDVNLVIGGHLAASSLAGNQRSTLVNMIASGLSLSLNGAARLERLGDKEYIAGVFPLSAKGDASAAGHLVLLQDWAPTERYLSQLHRQLLAAGGVIFTLALAGGLLFARRVSRPLEDMASAAGEIAAGDWTRRVPVRGSAEATVMAGAFNAMTGSLQHWYDAAKRRDDELREAQKMEAMGRLAGGIAHDFNNLLTTIRGYSELAMLRLKGSETAKEELSAIMAAVDRAAELTVQLLTFSRRQSVAPAAVRLDQLVASNEDMLRRVLGEDVELITSREPDLGYVRVDRGHMEQVLLNLVVNARDAMPEGGKLRIDLAAVDVGAAPHDVQHVPVLARYVRLSVTDTGSGMDRETAARIFEPFFTTKDPGHGTGLGLAIVYGIVEQAGGMVEVDTVLGRGTTFRVYLPQTTGVEEPVPSPAKAAPAPPAVLPARGSETVLVAEDDGRLRTLISTTLRQAGYTVFDVADGRHAVEIARARAGRVDLLLTDVVMLGMNGRTLAEQVRSISAETRVLYMSGYSEEIVQRHGIEASSASFIRKPFSMDGLMAKVRETLGAG